MKQGDLVRFGSNNQSTAIGIMRDWYNGFRDWDYPPYGDETVIVLWVNGKSDYTRRQYLEVVK